MVLPGRNTVVIDWLKERESVIDSAVDFYLPARRRIQSTSACSRGRDSMLLKILPSVDA